MSGIRLNKNAPSSAAAYRSQDVAGGLVEAATDAATAPREFLVDRRNGNGLSQAGGNNNSSLSLRHRSYTTGGAQDHEQHPVHRSMTVVTRQASHVSSVKDFFRGTNHQLERAIGLPWKNSAEQEKWNRRRLRMTQRCGMKLRAGVDSDSLACMAASPVSRTGLRDISNAQVRRSDFLDGSGTRLSVGISGEASQARRDNLSQDESQYDARQSSRLRADAAAASNVDVLPKESVFELTMKGLRRAVGTPKSRNRRLYGTTSGTGAQLDDDRFMATTASLLAHEQPSSNFRHTAEVQFVSPSQRTLHVMLPTNVTADKTDAEHAVAPQQSKLSVTKTLSLDERQQPHHLPEVARPPIRPDEKLKPLPTRFRRAADDSTAVMQQITAVALTPDTNKVPPPDIQFDAEPDNNEKAYFQPPFTEEGEDVGDGITRGGLNVSDIAAQIPDTLLQRRPSLLPDMLGRNDLPDVAVGRSVKRPHTARSTPTWEDHRPYFTYWVTTAQILVTCIGLSIYGFGPFGLQKAERSAMVMTTALALEAVDFYEPSSFWLGPRAQHLVHLGAKYTPCMRSERQIKREMQQLRDQERKSACCVRNDGSGCVQATEDACSTSISRWMRWPDAVGSIGGWTGGSVCGLDPRYCHDPSPAVALLTWNRSDITTWPKCYHNHENAELSTTSDHFDAACRENGTNCRALALTAEPHMACELLGRPCCYGIRGQCRLATREFCEFVKGYYHEDAFLCSQVSCLEQVCGMVPFFHADRPNQFYRLFTSLFVHAGLLHLVLTVLVQYFYMAELEIMCGWWRMAVVYLLSGITGNLVSAIFLPDVPEVGPSASQFALFGLLLVEVVDKWIYYETPWRLLIGVVGLVLLFIGLGTLPWIDNFAQTFGFLSGLLLSAFFMPYMAFGTGNVRRLIKWLALALFVILFTLLVVFFYFLPLDKYDCPACSWLNCIPFHEDFCNDQNSYFFPKGYSSFS